MKLPPGYSHPPGAPSQSILTTESPLWAKQAPRAWFAKFNSIISQHDISGSSFDTDIFLIRSGHGITILLFFVDDMIIIGNDMQGI